jgi:hypothetical protein
MTNPTFTLFTRMFSGASWIANVLVNDRQAARLTLVAKNVGSGYLPYTALMLMIRPPPRARMWGTTAREHRIIENSFTSRSACQSSSLRVSKAPGWTPPALLTRMSMPPRASADRAHSGTCPGSVTSHTLL